jgi:hypothetical protein
LARTKHSHGGLTGPEEVLIDKDTIIADSELIVKFNLTEFSSIDTSKITSSCGQLSGWIPRPFDSDSEKETHKTYSARLNLSGNGGHCAIDTAAGAFTDRANQESEFYHLPFLYDALPGRPEVVVGGIYEKEVITQAETEFTLTSDDSSVVFDSKLVVIEPTGCGTIGGAAGIWTQSTTAAAAALSAATQSASPTYTTTVTLTGDGGSCFIKIKEGAFVDNTSQKSVAKTVHFIHDTVAGIPTISIGGIAENEWVSGVL